MEDLYSALCNGQTWAYQRLYELYADRIYRFARRMVSETEAEDIVQETFLRVFQSIQAQSLPIHLEVWLFQVARNMCRDTLRKERIKRAYFEHAKLRSPSSTGEPEQDVIKREQIHMLGKAIQMLPEDQREILLLRENAELSFREIAEIVGCPLNTALARMYYALRNLRRTLGLSKKITGEII